MPDLDILDALDDQERRLAQAAISFIATSHELSNRFAFKTDGDVQVMRLPIDQKKMREAERTFDAVVAGELGIEKINLTYSVANQVPREKTDQFITLRRKALENANTILAAG